MVGAWGGCAEGEEGGGTAVRWEGASPSPPLGHTAWRDLSLTARRGHRGGRAAAGLSPPTAAGGARRRFFLAGLSARTQPEHVDQLLELPGEGDAREDPKAEAKNGGRGVAGGGMDVPSPPPPLSPNGALGGRLCHGASVSGGGHGGGRRLVCLHGGRSPRRPPPGRPTPWCVPRSGCPPPVRPIVRKVLSLNHCHLGSGCGSRVIPGITTRVVHSWFRHDIGRNTRVFYSHECLTRENTQESASWHHFLIPMLCSIPINHIIAQ